jgi:hypothetical protein
VALLHSIARELNWRIEETRDTMMCIKTNELESAGHDHGGCRLVLLDGSPSNYEWAKICRVLHLAKTLGGGPLRCLVALLHSFLRYMESSLLARRYPRKG